MRDHRQYSRSSRTFRRDNKWGLTGHWVLRNHQARQYVATDRTLDVTGPSDETTCDDWQDIGCYGTIRRDNMWRLTGHWMLRNHQARQYVATDRTLGVTEPSGETICGDWQDIGCYGTIRRDNMWRLTGHWVLRNHQTRQYVAIDRTLGVTEPLGETICGDWQDIGCYGTIRRDNTWRLTGH